MSISFETKLFEINSWTILKLPKSASVRLPSRGMNMVKGTINGFSFQTALEPDGKGSHWFRVDKVMLKIIGAKVGETVMLDVDSVKEWPEPNLPADLKNALVAVPQALKLWKEITPMARWDWIRWINSTKNPETRKKRIDVSCSKLKKEMRRPCCFNRSMCTEPDVSNNGVLLEPNYK